MTTEKIVEALRLLAEAVSLVTVNTYVEQGVLAAGKVFELLGKVEEIVKEEPVKDCDTCLYEDPSGLKEPCSVCTRRGNNGTPSRWVSKEVEVEG